MLTRGNRPPGESNPAEAPAPMMRCGNRTHCAGLHLENHSAVFEILSRCVSRSRVDWLGFQHFASEIEVVIA